MTMVNVMIVNDDDDDDDASVQSSMEGVTMTEK